MRKIAWKRDCTEMRSTDLIMQLFMRYFGIRGGRFQKHKDVVAYFNRTYAATEKIPREIGRKLARLQQKREKSDYDDFYIASKEETMEQIENTKSVILAVKDYLSRMEN